MKNKIKKFLKSVIFTVTSCLFFVAIGYFYLQENFTQTDTETQSVPYYQQISDNVGILFKINDDFTFLYLDFEREVLTVSISPDVDEEEVYGYSVDYKLESDLDLVREIVDYVGGLELTVDDETLRYTGFQVVEILSTSKTQDLKRAIVNEIISKIAQNGVGTDFFVSLIENSKTDLSVWDCYYWKDGLKKLSLNPQMID